MNNYAKEPARLMDAATAHFMAVDSVEDNRRFRVKWVNYRRANTLRRLNIAVKEAASKGQQEAMINLGPDTIEVDMLAKAMIEEAQKNGYQAQRSTDTGRGIVRLYVHWRGVPWRTPLVTRPK